jgi:anti-anti-sigma regulatory factor
MATAAEQDGSGASWFMAPTDGSGRVDTSSLTQLLERVKKTNCRCLILDLRAARVMQAYDVKLLVQARDMLRERQGRLRVVARAGGAVARLLKQHQLDHLFFLCESLEEAWSTRAGRRKSDETIPAADQPLGH